MKHNEVLKSIGFSDKFLKALDEYDKSVPDITYDEPFNESQNIFNLTDTSGKLIINRTNNDYYSNIIIR